MEKSILFSLCLVLFLGCKSLSGQPQPKANDRPNVILIITDDQGYGDLSCHGNPILKTPHIDALYAQSTRLTDFHVSPTCSPTRGALHTGHYSNRTGVWHTIAGRSLIKENEILLSQVLSNNGYATGMFGKWHLGDNYPFRPQDRGFQETVVHGGGGVAQQADHWNNDYFDDVYLHNGKKEAFAGYCTDVWFEEAMNFMESKRREKKPFYCYIATNAPHGPFYVDNKYKAVYQNNEAVHNPSFFGMISNIDENIGKLTDYLERNQLSENTILIYMTDNGTAAGVDLDGKTGLPKKGFNAGMRGKKGSMYEGGHRVPFFIRWPKGGVAAGKDIAELTSHVDVMPTLLDILNIKKPQGVSFDGISIKDLVLGKKDKLAPRVLITDSQRLEMVVKWRQSSTMQGPWRLINGKELYNISEDPSQQKDLAQQHPEKVKELRAAYEKWWTDLEPTFKETAHIALCPPQDPHTTLWAHDMHMDEGSQSTPWNHIWVRRGRKSIGWFSVRAQEAGQYTFTLKRWSPEASAPIRAGFPAKPAVPGTTIPEIAAGLAQSIEKAGISIAGMKKEQAVKEGDEGVSFTLDLPAGDHKLRAWFEEADGAPFTANYVLVAKGKR